MADHDELLSEMELIERLPTQERLKQAKRRRALQLKKWQDYEIDLNSKQHLNNRKNSINVKFQDHIMLLDAVMRKDFNEAQRLLELGVNPNLANEDGLTSIHQCCIDDSPELLKLLIQYGADVNVCDNDLWTPLHAAATCANLDICKILIENNAELLAVNTDGNMPYDICDDEICLEYIESEMAARGVTQQAIDIKRAEIEIKMLEDIKLLNLNNDDLNRIFPDQNGATFMHIACANGYTSVLEYLLENKASLNVRDIDGWTPLHVATFWGHQKAIELLIEYGADIYAKTYNDETVFDLSDDIDVREFIVQKKKECENNEKSSRTRSLKRTSTGVSRSSLYASNSSINSLYGSLTTSMTSSSIRRSSFRDKEKCRKLDTSFKEVLYANEYQRDDLESEEFHDKSLPNYENLEGYNDPFQHSIDSLDDKIKRPKLNEPTKQKQENHQPLGQSISINHENNKQQQQQTTDLNSTNLIIKLNDTKIPNQITINDENKHIYLNDDNNNLSLDLKNRQVFPLKSIPSNINQQQATTNTQPITSTSSINKKSNQSSSSSLLNSTSTTTTTTTAATRVNNNNNNNNSNNNKNNDRSLSPPFLTDDISITTETFNFDHQTNRNILSSTTISTNNSNQNNHISNKITQNNNVNYVNSNNKHGNGVSGGGGVITQQPATLYIDQQQQQQQQQQKLPYQQNNDYKKNINDNKTKYNEYPIIDTDGVKYKFKSDETIGGKSDISSSATSSKFNCSKCLKCTIM